MDIIDFKNIDKNMDFSKIDIYKTKLENVDFDFSKIPWWIQPFAVVSLLFASGGFSEKDIEEMQLKYEKENKEES